MRLLSLFLISLLGATPFAEGAPSRISGVDHALAASFLPLRFRVADAGQRGRLAELLKKQPQDSVATATWEGDELRISADMALRLGAGVDTAQKFRTRARHALEKLAGAGIEDVQPMWAQAYYPNDPSFHNSPQWALYNTGASINGVAGKAGIDIGMTKVWERYDGDDSLVIAVVDAGFNFNHPDLKGRWYRNMKEVNGRAGFDDDSNGVVDDTAGWDFVDNDNLPQDYLGHGSEVSGIIAASFDNNTGMAGMIPRVKILPIRVLDAVGSGTASNVAKGIQYAVKMKVAAINFSVGGGGVSSVLQAAFKAADSAGIPIVVAAGNDTTNLDANPAPPGSYGYKTTYVVAAHNQAGTLSSFSAYGAKTVAIAAPGENILSTGVPSPTGVGGIIQFSDNFDAGISGWTFATATDFGLSTLNPFTANGETGTSSLQWKATAGTWAATANLIDLTGKVGAVLWFLLDYTQGSSADQLIIETQLEGSTPWTALGNINARVAPQWLSFDAHVMDGKKFKLRFRTSTTGSVTARKITLDDIRIYYYDASVAGNATAYSTGAGTSFATPYMTGYIALLRTACKRMNVPFTRALALAGSTPASTLTGKDSTNGRLDASKGLDFYFKTLPSLQVKDSTKTAWAVGDAVVYNLAIAPSATYAYNYVVPSAMSNSVLSSLGAFTWNTTGKATGSDTVRFNATLKPLVLRKMMVFALNPKSTDIGPATVGPGMLLWIGEQAFVLPAGFFHASSHELRVESIDAGGRTREIFSGTVQTPAASRKIGYQLSGLTGPGWKIWVDGAVLASLRKANP